MRLALFVLFSLQAFAQQVATLTLDPPVIYDCTAGVVGKATLRWSGASGPVMVRVGPAQVIMTGFGPTSGSAETATWVSNGLEFRLVNQSGVTEAYTVADVRCGANPNAPGNGLVSNSFFPLEVGTTWIFKYNSRGITSDYMTWRVSRKRQIGTQLYSEIVTDSGAVIADLREDAGGVLWQITATEANPTETIYLNPGAETHRTYASSLGQYPDAISRSVLNGGLLRQEQAFVRGVGLVSSTNTLLTGSSGGFTDSLELIDFHLATGPRVTRDQPRIVTGIDSLLLDVTGRKVDNCAVPCYFVACGFAGGSDPVGTYKPCVRTRIEANAGGVDVTTTLAWVNASGQTVYTSPQVTAGGDAVRYVQMPLYSAPNVPLPSGTYKLVGRMVQGSVELASSSVTVQIQ